MAYDRYDTRGDRSRWPNDDRDRRRDEDYGHSRGENRGFFERAGDEIASWFGDDEAERRRDREHRMEDRGEGRFGRDLDRDRAEYGRERSWGRGDFDRDRGSYRDRDFRGERGLFGGRGGYRGANVESGFAGGFSAARDQDYRPLTGDYGRREGSFSASGLREQPSEGRSSYMDPHYQSWRQRQLNELDRDYDDYRRENQSRFDQEFSDWRGRRQQKRGLLGQIREQMEVVGNDGEHVGTVDRVAGDRIILTKSDEESGGSHHSLSCSDIDRIEENRVILDCSSEQARQRWRDESRNRALFEREDQGEMGPRVLDRSFEGTYR